MTERRALQRSASLGAALLMLFGLLTGILVSAAMTGKIPADPHAMLASHLNALLGSPWVVAVAFTLPFVRFGLVGCRRLVGLTLVANASNWVVTALKAFLKVSGVDFIGEGKNDLVFGLLTALVVIPSLVAAAGWVYGLMGPAPTQVHER